MDLFDIEEDQIIMHCRSEGPFKNRREKARAKNVAVLKKVFPKNIYIGEEYHFITAGDVNAMAFPAQLFEKERFSECYFSTWRMARPDVLTLDYWLSSGKMGSLMVLTGDFFRSCEPDIYAQLLDVLQKHQAKIQLFRNHCKIFLLGNDKNHYVIVGSANFTSNPRAEQTVILNDKEVYLFYRQWFEDAFSGVLAKDSVKQHFDFRKRD